MGSMDDVHDSAANKVSEATNQKWSDVSDELSRDPEAFAYKYKEYLSAAEFAFLGGAEV